MNVSFRSFGSIFSFLYAWTVTIFTGAVLMDALYANLVPQAAAGFRAVTDFLLPAGLVTFLAAMGAIAFAGKYLAARFFFLASFSVLLLEFVIPPVFSLLRIEPGPGVGTVLRIGIHSLASLLAFAGLYSIYRGK